MTKERQQPLPETEGPDESPAGDEPSPQQHDDEIGFSAAVSELEGILGRIEGEEIDIDRLAAELRRATALLEICRARVRKAEAEVIQVVQALDPGSEVPSE